MTIIIDIDNASSGDNVPKHSTIRGWAKVALSNAAANTELSIRIVDESESAELNSHYRQKNAPTNVLSFPAEIPELPEIALLGDIVICAAIVEQEAIEQKKSTDAHWCHMVIHGTLHLIGYDHINDKDAMVMEALETQIIMGLGFPAPYELREINHD